MTKLAIPILAALVLLAKLGPVAGMLLVLLFAAVAGWLVYSTLLGLWRLVYYGGRNQRDRSHDAD